MNEFVCLYVGSIVLSLPVRTVKFPHSLRLAHVAQPGEQIKSMILDRGPYFLFRQVA